MSSNLAERMENRDSGSVTPIESKEPLDIPKLMTEIRARVKSELENSSRNTKPFKGYTASQDKARKAGELVHSEELYYLNTHWQYGEALNLSRITSHRKGLLGKLIVGVKRKIANFLWEVLLRDYFHAEKEFQMRLVQFLNSTSTYVDERDASAFWELVRKIDYDVSKAINRIEKIADEQGGNVRSLERSLTDTMNSSLRELNDRITQLRALGESSQARLNTVESVSSGVERIVARLTRAQPQSSSADSSVEVPADTPNQSYVMLENRYRGSEEEISQRLSIYPQVFKESARALKSGPVLEIGAGRGELQLLFKEAGVPSYGIDLDQAMVDAAQERGADVRLADVSVLDAAADGSLGGVIAIQVVEHLTRDQLARLFEGCRRKVAQGGRIVFETINPQSILALSSNYFRDPTHIWPLHPDTLSFAMTMAGLKVVEVKKLSPVPTASLLKRVEVEEYMTPRWMHAVDTLNCNVDQLNDLIYGYQDYAIIAEVP